MATAVIRQAGRTIGYTPVADVSAGDVVVQGDLIGVAPVDIPAGTKGALMVEGVVEFAKATGASTGLTAGEVVYWDAGDKVATDDDDTGSNPLLGKAVAAAGDAVATVEVLLTP